MSSGLNRAARWVKRRFPRAYQRLLPLGRALLKRDRASAGAAPWEKRRHHRYYWEVVRLAQAYAPEGDAMIDVGAGQADIVSALPGFRRRVLLDMQPIAPKPAIETVQANFLEWEPGTRFDLVLCLQVLEHLREPAPFARKLFDIGRTVIISVPYRWPADAYPLHVQDPVDEAKLEHWTGRRPTETRIVADERERLIAVYAEGGTRVE